MKKRIQLHDKTFEVAVTEEQLLTVIDRLAGELTRDYADKNPVFVVVLNGAFVFASDLLRKVNFPCAFSFMKYSSYSGTQSTGVITEQLAVSEDIEGRHVVVIEDIVETGISMKYMLDRLWERKPASIEVCVLSHKPECCKVPDLTVKYIGMTLPDAFVVGYGFDYNQAGRYLRDIYALVED